MGVFNQTDFDLHHAAYIARTTRIDRDGWMMESMQSPVVLQDRGQQLFVQRMRRLFGETLIAMGERMQGARADQLSTPATEEFGPAL